MLRRLESWPNWKLAVALTIAWRVFYSCYAAALSFLLHPDPALIHGNLLTDNLPGPGGAHYALLGIWERFDTLWYLRIAQHGYDLPRAVIFYPLYPAAIRIASWTLPSTAAALLVSTVAAGFFFAGLLRLGAETLSSLGRLRMLLIVCVWPGSFILFAGYAEALTLALVVWAVLFARNDRWWLATACGFAAGLARPSGVLVAIPLAVMALRSRRLASLPVLVTPVGALCYWGWLRWSGRLSVVQTYQSQGVSLVPPWEGVAEVLRLIVVDHDAFLAVKFGLLAFFVVLSLRREVRLEDRLFALAVVLQVFMAAGHPLIGATRYLLLVYPVFMVLGGYAARRWSLPRFTFYLAGSAFLNLVWMWAFLDWRLVI